jgi:CheY-like chemotaxis protein
MSQDLGLENAPIPAWRVLLVEDDEQMRDDIIEYLSELEIGERTLIVSAYDFDGAISEVADRRADVIILDVFKGEALIGAQAAGLEVLKAIQQHGFISVILYTAHPEKVEEEQTTFVRLVGKDVGSLKKLGEVLGEIFGTRVPQMFRAIDEHLDFVLRDYMWKFVDRHWDILAPISGKPEFLRVILKRLAASLSTDGVSRLSNAVFGDDPVGEVAPGKVHPAEYYIMPPVDLDSIRMGDVRVRNTGDGEEYLIVVWPSCDMVRSEGRVPKTDRVLCVRCDEVVGATEILQYKEDPNSKKRKAAVQDLLKNNRAQTSDRYHFLPGLCDIPDLLLDFQKLEIVPFDECAGLRCPATVASPFAESISSRLFRYIGRIGTPDIDLDLIFARLG